ncbi:flagellar motor switch protein FliM [Luteithermobacter gelatinilyticus]|uniref:flagellar motor switch protein FliM n=1 Tax=Luteithermobacter gelatinilyticus TaxID=2582913 RepID=UPI0011057B44|nr:flagellar motor switch protein FliM [Luteithermobacter gelatinilyticus]|tara:strand:- start:12694 stop:13779 length:1086 start_codon:yes stop_codon:yes gene_type:complete
MAEDEIDNDAVAAEWEAMAAAEAGEDGFDDDETDMAAAMGADRVLDQDEIDSLLGFDGDDDDDTTKSGIQALINSGLVAYERLPMLDIIFDRYVRMMSTSLRNFTSDNFEVSIDNMTSIRFGDYLNSIPLPAMLAVFKAKEWDNYGLITIDSNLIYSVVDALLGGRRGTAPMRIEGRPYTTIEHTLVEQMLQVILKDLCAAFEPLSAVTFTLDRLETNPRFATIAQPSNAALLIKMRADMEDRGGRLEMVLPYATIEPVRELLLQRYMGEKFGRDTIWENHLASELLQTDVSLEAVLDEQTMTLGEVLGLEVGQTLLLNAVPDGDIDIRCSGVPMMRGKIGRMGRYVAVKIHQIKRHMAGG